MILRGVRHILRRTFVSYILILECTLVCTKAESVIRVLGQTDGIHSLVWVWVSCILVSWLTHGDVALECGADLLTVAEQWLITARAPNARQTGEAVCLGRFVPLLVRTGLLCRLRGLGFDFRRSSRFFRFACSVDAGSRVPRVPSRSGSYPARASRQATSRGPCVPNSPVLA